jgi:hypothetical protein
MEDECGNRQRDRNRDEQAGRQAQPCANLLTARCEKKFAAKFSLNLLKTTGYVMHQQV